MKCNHLALAIGGCFSKRRTAALFESVSEVSAARAPEQRQRSAWLPGMGAGQGTPTNLPMCPLGVPGRSWVAPHGTKCHLPAPFLPPAPSWASMEKFQPQIASHWAGGGDGTSQTGHHHQSHHAPIYPLKMRGLVLVSTPILLGG